MSDDAAGEAKPAEIEVAGITDTQYRMWRTADPVAVMLRKYYADFAADLVQGITDRWLNDQVDLVTEQEAKGFVKAMREMADLPLISIARFYDQQKQIAIEAEEAKAARRAAMEKGETDE